MRSAPNSSGVVRKSVAPIATPRTMRRQSARGITSMPAGKMVPIAAFPLLREDGIRSGRLRFNLEMNETAEVLMNAVNVRFMAYLVPNLALERFNGSMDQLNLSYEGKPPLEGEAVVPYIETAAFGAHGANAIYKYLGLHANPTDLVNTAYLEAYNAIWNFRAQNRSPDLALRTRLQTDLAPAFWQHEQFKHIVPDFDQAAIDGEVPLNITGFPDKARVATTQSSGGNIAVWRPGAIPPNYKALTVAGSNVTGSNTDLTENASLYADLTNLVAELEGGGIRLSLSNIELARKTQAFAQLRTKYNAHEDWVINLLMDGIHIPEQAFKQPMLLSDRQTIFGMAKRYATDAGNLMESAVNGATFLDMAIQVPRLGTGGIVMIVAESSPDQLFERQRDPYLHTTAVEQLPQYLRDTLDPQKVDVVKNGRMDASHATPNDTFGFEPMNARWNIDMPRVGGEFYRPVINTGFDEKRQRIWAVETLNPTLSTDFYLCTTMHQKPFLVTNQDPFEVTTVGDIYIEGNTVFGGHLIEATDDYEKVLANAPQDRIEKEA